ncbi:hypothetical protein PMI15_04538 [Polaromonas sp. CF318]|uniref:hypothetical protein n=1 Tax=Polaromonas sp. CF318 TaxID=1144318 RepID=UPI000271272C|nr:hypothetical protein [Polaromonas sp. CF318]EJL77732.1 hypothetical protein PMI15_04538 [Polaromonas sp. CF318]
MNTSIHHPVIEAPVPGEEHEKVSSTSELLLGLALGICALAAVHLAGYAVLLIAPVLRRLLDQA